MRNMFNWNLENICKCTRSTVTTWMSAPLEQFASDPSNEKGSHWFMSVASGQRIIRTRWTSLPAPKEVIDKFGRFGRTQGIPPSVTFADRQAKEIEDNLDQVAEWSDEDDDSFYSSDDESTS